MGDGTDGSLDGISIQFDTPVGQEQTEPAPVFGDVFQCLAQGRFRRDAGTVVGEPGFQIGYDRCGAFLSRDEAGHGITPPDFGLDATEFADTLHAFFGNWRWTGACDLDQFAAGMRSAIGQPDCGAGAVGRDQPVVAGITIDLQDAAEALQYPFGMATATTRRIGEGYAGRIISAPWPVVAGQRP